MTTLTELLIERDREHKAYFKNYLQYAKEIKKEVEGLLGKVQVFIFGSILRKNEIPRDVDILIISPKLKTTRERSKILAQIWRKIGFTSPFELHFATPQEYQNWWRYFLKEKLEI